MARRPLLCYITDRKAFPGNETDRRRLLLRKIAEAAAAGVDYIQLREKDLSARQLEALAGEAINAVRTSGPRTAVLINSRVDVALATAADGVHLRSDDISPAEVRGIWPSSARSAASEAPPRNPVIGVSCHSTTEVSQAAAAGADFAVFAPVFEKKDRPGIAPTGVASLQRACTAKIPVLALGGITLENAQICLDAGAAGIAAIRLFQEHDVAGIVRAIRH